MATVEYLLTEIKEHLSSMGGGSPRMNSIAHQARKSLGEVLAEDENIKLIVEALEAHK